MPLFSSRTPHAPARSPAEFLETWTCGRGSDSPGKYFAKANKEDVAGDIDLSPPRDGRNSVITVNFFGSFGDKEMHSDCNLNEPKRNKMNLSAFRHPFLLPFLLFAPSFAQAAEPSMAEAVDFSYTEAQTKKAIGGVLGRDRNQLTKRRNQRFGLVDSCKLKKNQASFGDAIEGAIRAHMQPRIFSFPEPVTIAYKIPMDLSKASAVSLISHPYCEVSSESLAHMLGAEFVPSSDVIKILQNFTKNLNDARNRYLTEVEAAARENRKPRAEPLQETTDYFLSVMGCIAYEESLAGPGDFGEEKHELDRKFQEFLAEAPGIQKKLNEVQRSTLRPSGVLVYTDRVGNYAIEIRALKAEAEKQKNEGNYKEEEFQKKVSALKEKYKSWTVLGMYQFSPDAYGNTRACFEEWNKSVRVDECKVNLGNSAATALALLSPAQTFNAYCGIAKINHANYTQINTSSPNGTDLSNLLQEGELKDPKDRCLSLVSRAGVGRVYAHFGPLRNSVKDNLGKVMKCVDGALKYKKVW